MAKKKFGTIAENRKARHEYFLESPLECGIELRGTEVKSLRAGKISFQDAFCMVDKGELWLHNLHIAPYEHGSHFNHQSNRKRKLLAHRTEINQLLRKAREKGYSLIPVKFYFKGALVKVEVALGKGKKLHDKRATIRDKDLARENERLNKFKY